MRKLLMLLMGMMCLTMQVWAQNRTITGRITSSGDGTPIPNATVTVKGTSTGVSTDPEGAYSISVPAGSRTLTVSSVGYTAVEVAVGSSNVLNVSMQPSNQQMDEVLVVAYGTVKKGEFTGSASQITAKEIERRPLTNVMQALVGSAPGIQTTTPGGSPGSSPGILIRGAGSINAGNAPLIVVDGVPYNGGLANINMDDVETITTLKDAATTAVYGSRGANGIIMITTKRGQKNSNRVSFKALQGYSSPAIPSFETVSASEYYPLMWEAFRNSLAYSSNVPIADANLLAAGLWPRFTSGPNAGRQNYNNVAYGDLFSALGYNAYNVPNLELLDENGVLNPSAQLLWADDLNWLDQSTRTGNRKEYGMTLSGGGVKSDYFGSFNYTDETGWALRSSIKRFAGRLGANAQPLAWFRTGFNISATTATFNNASTGGIANPFYFARYIGPIYPVHAHDPATGEYLLDGQGQRLYDYGSLVDLGLPSRPYNSGRHSLAESLWNKDITRRNIMSARTFADIIFTPWLKFTTNVTLDIQDATDEGYDNTRVGDGAPGGRLNRGFTKTSTYNWNQLLNFNKSFGSHNLTALLGHENYDYTQSSMSGMRQLESIEGFYEFNNFTNINSLSSNTTQQRIESYFSRFSYDYEGKYFLTGSFRRDGNSRFSSLVRWDNFWAVGAAWRLDRESFMNSIPWIDMLKLKANYGEVGNDNVSNYPYQALYSLGRNNAAESGVNQLSLPSPNLTWESANTLDIGVDFSFFKGRLGGSIEFFNRNTTAMIFSVPEPYHNGGVPNSSPYYFTIDQNIGSMYNRGFEMQISGTPIRSKDFTWNVVLNATTYKNKITKMPELTPEVRSGNFQFKEGVGRYDFFMRDYYGIDPEDGRVLYRYDTWDAANCRIFDNGKGGLDTVTTSHNNAKYNYIGHSSIPDVFGSIGNNFRYKDFELSFLLTYQLGGKVYDGVYGTLMSSGTYGNTMHVDLKNRWQAPGDITDVPRLDVNENTRAAFGAASSRWLTDASYLSINNISVAYNIPKSWLAGIKASNAKVYVSAENARFFTARRGMNVNGSFAGSTSDSYDAARIITAGVNFNF